VCCCEQLFPNKNTKISNVSKMKNWAEPRLRDSSVLFCSASMKLETLDLWSDAVVTQRMSCVSSIFGSTFGTQLLTSTATKRQGFGTWQWKCSSGGVLAVAALICARHCQNLSTSLLEQKEWLMLPCGFQHCVDKLIELSGANPTLEGRKLDHKRAVIRRQR
jgi:hypothetical protein